MDMDIDKYIGSIHIDTDIDIDIDVKIRHQELDIGH
jgi:hypothetical protein